MVDTKLIKQLFVVKEYLNQVFPYFTSRSFEFRSSLPLDHGFEPRAYVRTVCRGVYTHILNRDEREWPLAGRRHPGHGGDLRWALSQPHGNAWIRFSAWTATRVLRRAVSTIRAGSCWPTNASSFWAATIRPSVSPRSIRSTESKFLTSV